MRVGFGVRLGIPRQGGDATAVPVLEAVGFEKVPDWRSMAWHPDAQLLLAVHVDDFNMPGP